MLQHLFFSPTHSTWSFANVSVDEVWRMPNMFVFLQITSYLLAGSGEMETDVCPGLECKTINSQWRSWSWLSSEVASGCHVETGVRQQVSANRADVTRSGERQIEDLREKSIGCDDRNMNESREIVCKELGFMGSGERDTIKWRREEDGWGKEENRSGGHELSSVVSEGYSSDGSRSESGL